MKHNGVVTRILKTSSTTSGANAGSAAKARPAVAAAVPPVLPKDQDVDNIVAGISDLDGSPARPPAFASNMEKEIADLLSRGGSKARGPANKETPVVPAPVIAQPPITAKEGDRVTVRAPGHEEGEVVSSDGAVQVPPPPRPPPLPAELRDAVTARPPGRPLPPPLAARVDIVPAKPAADPVRVQVKPPPLPLPLGPRRDVHVDVIDAPAETRREPGGRGERREPPVEFWTDTSLVESVPPSDPNEVLPARRGSGGQRGTFTLGGQAIVLYGAAGDSPESVPNRPALPPALPAGPAPQPAAAQAPVVVAHPASPPATAWVQQPTTTAPKPLRARLQAAALGIAAGVAISMVVTWRPPSTPSTGANGLGAAPERAAAAMMTPGRAEAKPSAAPISAAPSAEPTSPAAALPAAPAAATKDSRSRVTPPASAQASAKPALTGTLASIHGPQATARASAGTAPETPVVKSPSLTGRVAGDEE